MAGYFNFSKLSSRDAERIHAIVTASLVVIVAFFYAKFFAAAIALYAEFDDDKNIRSIKQKTVQVPVRSEQDDYNLIVARNIFNSKNEIPDDDIGGMNGMQAYKKSSLEVELVGTIVVNDPSRSVAAVELKSEKKVEPFAVGDTILSKAVVLSIARRKVILRNTSTGELEYIGMKDDDDALPMSTSMASAGVKQLGQDRVLLDRKELNKSLENFNDLLTQARAVPNIENGIINGFRLFGIQPGSLYQKLGAQNGDVIKSVNGIDIKDPATAMSLFQQLQTMNKLEFKVERGGSDKTMFVDIR